MGYEMQFQAPPGGMHLTLQPRLKERKHQIAKEEWHEYSHELRR